MAKGTSQAEVMSNSENRHSVENSIKLYLKFCSNFFVSISAKNWGWFFGDFILWTMSIPLYIPS